MTRSIAAVLFTGTLALAGAACDVHVGDNGVSLDVGGNKATSEWTRRYTVNKGASLEILNTNGAIEVEPSTGADIEVTATITARAGSEEEAEGLIKKVVIKEEAASATQVRLRTTLAEGSGTLFGRRSANVEYKVKVPSGLTITAKTENGGVTLSDVSGTLTAATTNGGVRGKNLSGQVSMHTINGGVVLSLTHVTGPIATDVVNGGIRIDLSTDTKATLDAHAVNGGVSVDDGFKVTAIEQSRTRVSGSLNGGGFPVSASTVNGGVRIEAYVLDRPGPSTN